MKSLIQFYEINSREVPIFVTYYDLKVVIMFYKILLIREVYLKSPAICGIFLF